MNAFAKKMAVILAAAATTLAAQGAWAQATDNSAPKTRAEVKSELRQVEAAGYRPDEDRATYPAQIQAAEARVSAQQSGQAAPAKQPSQWASPPLSQ